MVEAVKTPEKAQNKPISKAKSSKPEASKLVYATFATGGKQYRVKVGDTLKIEKLPGTYAELKPITFDNVLMIDDGAGDVNLGTPFIKGSKVVATLNRIARHKTIDVIHYKQKSRYFKKYGHRQPYFEIKIDSIS
jgi:large subunit ribosomal protein L21